METKSILTSKAVWMAIIPIVAGLFGLSGAAQDVELTSDTALWIVSALSTIGGAGALWGRWVAKTQLTMPKLPKITGLPVIVILALPLALSLPLSGCAIFDKDGQSTNDDGGFERVTLQAANHALDGWIVTQKAIKTYLDYEICPVGAPPLTLCRKVKQSRQLQELSAAVTKELDRLRPLFEARPNDVQIAIAIASVVTQGYQAYYVIKVKGLNND